MSAVRCVAAFVAVDDGTDRARFVGVHPREVGLDRIDESARVTVAIGRG